MKKTTGFKAPLLFFTMAGLLVILFVVSGFLYRQNVGFKRENRTLIIQNDSIMSVNIELKRSLQQRTFSEKKSHGKEQPETKMNYLIQKILVPVDLSETSLNALTTAVSIAKNYNASVQVINIKENALDNEEDIYSNSAYRSREVLAALAGAIQHSDEINISISHEEGNVTDTIIKCALSGQSSLIVMGTHGASGYRQGFIGSNAYQVIKYASCPVLAVPPKRKYTSFNKVLFPIRPQTGALQQFDIAGHFLSSKAQMDVLGLSYRLMEGQTKIIDKIISEIKSDLDSKKIEAKPYWGKGINIAEEVLSFAQDTNPDLIILTSMLDVTTKSNFIGPYSQKILHCAKVPVLSLKKLGMPVFTWG